MFACLSLGLSRCQTACFFASLFDLLAIFAGEEPILKYPVSVDHCDNNKKLSSHLAQEAGTQNVHHSKDPTNSARQRRKQELYKPVDELQALVEELDMSSVVAYHDVPAGHTNQQHSWYMEDACIKTTLQVETGSHPCITSMSLSFTSSAKGRGGGWGQRGRGGGEIYIYTLYKCTQDVKIHRTLSSPPPPPPPPLYYHHLYCTSPKR